MMLYSVLVKYLISVFRPNRTSLKLVNQATSTVTVLLELIRGLTPGIRCMCVFPPCTRSRLRAESKYSDGVS